ncbi:MAG: alpha-L-rhamnosidase [Paenibacillaceae bacterium]|jgi:hypothetical protein|nr:alpha-L-rhamnosidase [Paenibacillaceae bacterium]
MLEQHVWQGRWIWREGILRSQHGNERVLFRRVFAVPEAGCCLRLRLTADSRYRLYINGEQVLAGPAKGDEHEHYYETIDVSDRLLPGDNVLAVMVVHYGGDGYASGPVSIHRSPWGGLLADGILTGRDGEELEALHSDERWLCLEDTSYQLMHESDLTFRWLGGIEKVDGRLYPHGWQRREYEDGSWENAVPFMDTTGRNGVLTPWRLAPRPIPFLFEEWGSFAGVKRVLEDGRMGETAVKSFFAGERQSEALFLPPFSRLLIELDAVELKTGYLRAEWQGGAGSHIRMLASECYEAPNAEANHDPEARRRKGRRDDSSPDRILLGDSDRYTAAGCCPIGGPGDESEGYEPFWFRTFRYVQLDISTDAEPLLLHRFGYRTTGYPLDVKTHFRCSSARMNGLWPVSLHTLQQCMHETYEDCPYYEQLQYAMDTYLQMLFHLTVDGDRLLPRKAIRHFHRSRLPCGLIQSRYPCCRTQVIPIFSLYWVMMLHDYYLYTGDETLLKECRSTVDGVLEWFQQRLNSEGLVGETPPEYWNFVDWADGWTSAVPAAAAYGPLTLHSLLYIAALRQAAELMVWSGRPGLAEEYGTRAARVKAAVQHGCWSEERQMYRDGPTAELYSQHTQIWAVMAGLLSKEAAGELMDRTQDSEDLAQVSYSMSFFRFRALSLAGKYARSYPLWDDWYNMLDEGLTTWAESSVFDRSDCHAWGAVPLYEFPSEILGVKPGAPGYGILLVAPRPGPLEWAKGTVTTPHGPVDVEWSIVKEQFQLTLTCPAGLPVMVELPDGTQYDLVPDAMIVLTCKLKA